MGRTNRLYSEPIAETILERLADGEGLNTICRDVGMPSRGAVRQWVDGDYQGFAARYARARELGIALLAEDILSIPDDVGLTPEEVAQARLQVESRKWLLVKLLPAVFGDRTQVDHSGTMTVRNLTDEQLAARLIELTAAPGSRTLIAGAGPEEDTP